MSLEEWDKLRILDRETLVYRKLTKNEDVSFKFVTYGNENDLSYQEKLKNIEIIPIYKYLNKPDNKTLQLLQSFIAPFKLKKVIGDTDIYKTNQMYGSWFPITLKLIRNKPLIVRTGFDLYSFGKKQNKKNTKLFFYFMLTQIAILFSSLYFVTSKTDHDYLLKKYLWLNKKKLKIRPNWVSETSYENIENRAADKVLSVGRLEGQKNMKGLIKEFRDSDIVIDIVGDGSEREDLKKLANELNVNVNFLGLVKYDELLDLYKNYKYFVLYSDFEGHPKSLIEAMSRGCICFVKGNENTKEIIQHNFNGFIIDELKESVPSFLSNKLRIKEEISISKKAYEFSINNYSLEKTINIEKLDYEISTQK